MKKYEKPEVKCEILKIIKNNEKIGFLALYNELKKSRIKIGSYSTLSSCLKQYRKEGLIRKIGKRSYSITEKGKLEFARLSIVQYVLEAVKNLNFGNVLVFDLADPEKKKLRFSIFSTRSLKIE